MEINKKFLENIKVGKLKNFDASVSKFKIDSREIKEGMGFVALSGENTDGHNFLEEAYENGATLLVISQKWADNNDIEGMPVLITESPKKALQKIAQEYRNSFQHPVFCLTGSNGKTTTLKMIEEVLSNNYEVHSTIGNYNNELGVPLSLLNHSPEHSFSVLELGTNHFGEIEFLTDIAQPTSGLITNIGIGHVKFLKNKQGVAQAKSELFQGLPVEGTAFINKDDSYISEMKTPKETISYGFAQQQVDYKGKISNIDSRARYTININGEYQIELPLPGESFAKNALAAFSVGHYYGISPADIVNSLENFEAVESRLKIIQKNYTIIDDTYNANPDSTRSALNTIANMEAKGNRYFVFGDMLELGEKSEHYHKKIGEYIANSKIDQLFTYGKFSHFTTNTARSMGVSAKHFDNKSNIADKLKMRLDDNDLILVKGSRGNQLELIVEEIR